MAEVAEGCQKCKEEAYKNRTTLSHAQIGAKELMEKLKVKTIVYTINNEYTFGTEQQYTAEGATGYFAVYIP
jgi:hypothetical protein